MHIERTKCATTLCGRTRRYIRISRYALTFGDHDGTYLEFFHARTNKNKRFVCWRWGFAFFGLGFIFITKG